MGWPPPCAIAELGESLEQSVNIAVPAATGFPRLCTTLYGPAWCWSPIGALRHWSWRIGLGASSMHSVLVVPPYEAFKWLSL